MTSCGRIVTRFSAGAKEEGSLSLRAALGRAQSAAHGGAVLGGTGAARRPGMPVGAGGHAGAGIMPSLTR